MFVLRAHLRPSEGRWVVRRKRRRVRRVASKKSRAEHLVLGPLARAQVHALLAECNAHYGYTYHKVFIRNTRTRWGSCSSRGNLGFNYRIAKLPQELARYIVVHELCHLKEFNHSAAFWALVAELEPQWKQKRKALHRYRLS